MRATTSTSRPSWRCSCGANRRSERLASCSALERQAAAGRRTQVEGGRGTLGLRALNLHLLHGPPPASPHVELVGSTTWTVVLRVRYMHRRSGQKPEGCSAAGVSRMTHRPQPYG